MKALNIKAGKGTVDGCLHVDLLRLQGFDISCLQLKCACVDLGVKKQLRVDTRWHEAGSKCFPLHGPVVSASDPPPLCWPVA